MRYVIRKIPERDTSYLERLLPEAIVVSDTEHRGAIWSFSESLKRANDDAIYIQDDMILCRDFKRRAQEVIDQHYGSVVVFANCFEGKYREIYKGGFYSTKQAGFLLCTYIPKRIADLFLQHEKDGTWHIPERMVAGQFDDLNWCMWMQFINEDVYLQIPNLAGHPANQSSIVESRPPRLCWNFDYDDCEPTENMDRTLNYYHKHRTEYEIRRRKNT